MKFVAIEKIPSRKKKKLQRFIEEFINCGDAQVEIIFLPEEYIDAHSCYCSFYKAAKISGYNIIVHLMSNRVFIEKRNKACV